MTVRYHWKETRDIVFIDAFIDTYVSQPMAEGISNWSRQKISLPDLKKILTNRISRSHSLDYDTICEYFYQRYNQFQMNAVEGSDWWEIVE